MFVANPAQNPHAADKALMERIALGNRAAYALLVERHNRRLYALARRMAGSRAEAEEIVQEALLRVWTHAGQWSAAKGRFTTMLSAKLAAWFRRPNPAADAALNGCWAIWPPCTACAATPRIWPGSG